MTNKPSLTIKFHEPGGPEVLKLEEEVLSDPKENEVLIHHHAIGVNFVDTYYRSGLYPVSYPSGLGSEAAGVVETIGSGVKHLKVGDRVAYSSGLGSYAEKRIMTADSVVKVPEGVSFEEAASVLLKGLTVHYLFKSIFPLKANDQILFHAAAGGVGLIACQWARHLGAELIGTVSSPEKAELAKSYGAWETINYTTEDVVHRVKELTQGRKLPVVFDSVGKSTWEISLQCLRSKGLMVSFGNASGPVTGVNLGTLASMGSLFVTRPILAHYMDTYEKLSAASQEVFSLVRDGVIKVQNIKTFKLQDAAEAHRELADRKRTGGLILLP